MQIKWQLWPSQGCPGEKKDLQIWQGMPRKSADRDKRLSSFVQSYRSLRPMVKVDPMCHRKKGREWPILWTGQKIKEQRLPSIHFKDRRDGGCDKILPVRWKTNSDRWMRSWSLWSVLQIWLRCPNHLWTPRWDWRSKTTPGHDPHFWIKRGCGKMRHGGKKSNSIHLSISHASYISSIPPSLKLIVPKLTFWKLFCKGIPIWKLWSYSSF